MRFGSLRRWTAWSTGTVTVLVSVLVLAGVLLRAHAATAMAAGTGALQRAGFTAAETGSMPAWLASWLEADLDGQRLSPAQARARATSVQASLGGAGAGSDASTVAAAPQDRGGGTAALPCPSTWDGTGTGAWYKVDSNCNSNWHATTVSYCWPTVTPGLPGDGFYVSLGVFSTRNNRAADIGFTWADGKWWAYAADMGPDDRPRWHYGAFAIDPVAHPCADVSLRVGNGTATLLAADPTTGAVICYHDAGRSVCANQTFTELDPAMNLNASGAHIGFYRFDSVAQGRETLRGGSRLEGSYTANWRFYGKDSSGNTYSVPVQPRHIDQAGARAPGRCCNAAERNTITVSDEIRWSQSRVSIFYPPDTTSLRVSLPQPALPVGAVQQATGTWTYSDGTTKDVTQHAVWTSSNPGAVRVDAGGRVTAVQAGTATITARYGGKSFGVSMTVQSPVSGLSVTPATVALASGAGQQLAATARFSDGSSRDVTSQATWTSSDTRTAAISTGGYATGGAPGTATVTASYGGQTAGATVSVAVACADGAALACAIPLRGTASGSVGYRGNMYYQFEATAGTRYTITLTPGRGDPDLYVYGPSHGEIDRSDRGAGVTDRVTFTASTTGRHYVRVYGYSAASFTLNTSGSGGGSDGCTLGSSLDCSIPLSGTTTGSVGHRENKYYQFEATAGTRYTITLTPGRGDPDLYVYGPSHGEIDRSDRGAGVTDRVTFTASTTGRHYIRVYGYSATSFTLGR